MNSGKIWPYSIGAAIVLVFGFCVATIVVTSKAELDESNLYMQNYHQADKDANKIIMQKIEFDKRYKIKYLGQKPKVGDTNISYKITTNSSKPINNAKIELVLTRPGNIKNDIKLNNPKVENGVYTFEHINLPLKGRWDVMAKITVGEFQRYYNLKTDTRSNEVVEF